MFSDIKLDGIPIDTDERLTDWEEELRQELKGFKPTGGEEDSIQTHFYSF